MNARDETCKATREDIDVSDAASKVGEGVEMVWWPSEIDMDSSPWNSRKVGLWTCYTWDELRSINRTE